MPKTDLTAAEKKVLSLLCQRSLHLKFPDSDPRIDITDAPDKIREILSSLEKKEYLVFHRGEMGSRRTHFEWDCGRCNFFNGEKGMCGTVEEAKSVVLTHKSEKMRMQRACPWPKLNP